MASSQQVKVIGLSQTLVNLERYQKRLEIDLENLVKRYARDTRDRARTLAPVDTGYLRRSIIYRTFKDQKTGRNLSFAVIVQAEYGAYVELGTRSTRAQPYLMPAFDEMAVKFTTDVRRTIERRSR